ncbi:MULTISPECIES: hypothetical protein [unclassified Marinitoga]|uniref:hypothetical protein n=1 Tax=unclassified Marinitoga TaxID=2640159 RepID=UPI000950662D|nr:MULTISPECIES: hypothetical protein [unclassified Marinitoga]APT75299.1 hypothetical protein LN42_02010 [Marinitoga sp. 1137]NUU96772.1 hypothetical protein [Marinitoga sp. 1138]
MKYKLILNPPKNEIIQDSKIKADDLLYLIVHSIIDISNNSHIESNYIKALKRIIENNENQLRNAIKNTGIKVVKKNE